MNKTQEAQESPAEANKNFAELILPSGKIAAFPKEPMGIHMEKALAGIAMTGMISIALGLLGQCGTIDGKRYVYEELRFQLSALDAYRLAQWINNSYERFPETGKEGAARAETPL